MRNTVIKWKAVGSKPNLYVAKWQDDSPEPPGPPATVRNISLLTAQSQNEAHDKFLAWTQEQGIKLAWLEFREIPLSTALRGPVFVREYRLY